MLKLPDWFVKFSRWVGKCSWLKKILHPFYYGLNDLLANHRNRVMHKNGLAVLKDFDECLTGNGFHYSLIWGSMLGAIREHGFIKHDLDTDVVMWAEDYSPRLHDCLINAGFCRERQLLVEDGKMGREETYEKKGVSLDIYYIYPVAVVQPAVEQKDPYCCDFLAYGGAMSFSDSMKKYGRIVARRIHLPYKKEFVRVPFEDLQLPICTNADELMRINYGNDYMIPNPEWSSYRDRSHVIVWDNDNVIYKQ